MIELILRDDVASLGKAGELVKVKPGYARNFLLPQGLAFEATAGNRKRIEAQQRVRAAQAAADRAAADELAAQLDRINLEFTAKAGEDGKLFGSVTSADIAAQLEAKGFPIDRRKIELEHPLKELGHHMVPVRLHHEVIGEARVNITAEE